MSAMRGANAWGYGWGQQSNLPDQGPRRGRCSTGVLVPYVRMAGRSRRFMNVDLSQRTNCSCSTVNAIAVALSHLKVAGPRGRGEFYLPMIGGEVMPAPFYQLWQLIKCEREYYRGSARAVQRYNVGARVKGHLVRRGDAIQINWVSHKRNDDPRGHSVFCYQSRKVSADETRFLILSAQIATFGIGVPLNAHSLAALAEEDEQRRERVRYANSSTRAFVDRPPEDLDDPAYVARVMAHGNWYVVRGSGSDGAGISPISWGQGGFADLHVSRPHRPFPCFPISLNGRRSLALADGEQAAAAAEGGGVDEHALACPIPSRAAVEAYYRNTEEGPGGYFPLGSGRVWHGGVHLYPDRDDGVYAACDGRVVCARLAPPDPEKWPLGSPNFVLLHHKLKLDGAEREFYTLYMHLYQFPRVGPRGALGSGAAATVRFQLVGDDEEPIAGQPYTLKVGEQEYRGETDDDGRLVQEVTADHDTAELTFHLDDDESISFPVSIERPAAPEGEGEAAGEGEGQGGEEEEEAAPLTDRRLRIPWLRDVVLAPAPGTPEADLDPVKLYLRVRKNPTREVKLGEEPVAAGDLLELDPTDDDAFAVWLGKGQRCDVTRVQPSQASGTIDTRRFPAAAFAVHDAYPARFAQQRKDLEEGKVVDFWDDALEVAAGELIGFVGSNLVGGGLRPSIHVEVFSADLIPCWVDAVTFEDPNADLFVDRAAFMQRLTEAFDEVELPSWTPESTRQVMGPMLSRLTESMIGQLVDRRDPPTRAEVSRFYRENPSAALLRDVVTKHPSEWSDEAGWDRLDQQAGQQLYGHLPPARLTALREQMQRYLWWTSELSSGGLPGSKNVVHYHPVRFLEWVDTLRRREACGGQGSDLHDSVFELNYKPS